MYSNVSNQLVNNETNPPTQNKCKPLHSQILEFLPNLYLPLLTANL